LVMYWERCGICGKYEPVNTCKLHSSTTVCPWCCLFCGERSKCDKPVWFPEAKVLGEKEIRIKEKIEREKRMKTLLEELMSKLE